jgi:FeS assembly SUF system regulator
MILLSKLADYGVILVTHLAEISPAQANAVQLADATRLTMTTAAKVLKLLSRAGIVSAVRGAAGGYHLARPAAEISIADIIRAIDGGPALTECTGGLESCSRHSFCSTRPHWHRINEAVGRALGEVTINQMTVPRFDQPITQLESVA